MSWWVGRGYLLDGASKVICAPQQEGKTRMDSITITAGTYNKINKLLSLVGKTSESGRTSLTLGDTYDKESVIAEIFVPNTTDHNGVYVKAQITESGNASTEYMSIEVDPKDFTHQINEGLEQNPACRTITLEKNDPNGKILVRFTPNNGEITGKYINPSNMHERNRETITELFRGDTPLTHSVTLTPTEMRTMGQAATVANSAGEHQSTEMHGVYVKLGREERVYGAMDNYKAVKHTCRTEASFEGCNMGGSIRIPQYAIRAAEALTPGRGKGLTPVILYLNAGDNTGVFIAPNGTVYFTFSTLQGEEKAPAMERIIFENTKTDMGRETIDIDGDALNQFVADVKKKTRSTKRVYVTITPDDDNDNKDTVTLSADYYEHREAPRNILTRTVGTAPRDPDLYVRHASISLSQLIASLNALAPTKGTKLGVVSLEMSNQAHSKTVLLSHAVLEGEKPVVDSVVVVGTAYFPYNY